MKYDEKGIKHLAVSDRTFGVEIECTYGARPTGKSDVYNRINWGERDPMRQRAIKDIKANKDLARWASNVGIDGSGIEIRSPILKGQEGIEELGAFFDFLIEKGSTVTNQDGMHVHHGAEDFSKDWKRLYYACASWGHWTPQIKEMVASRRRNGGMCPDAFNRAEVLQQLQAACFGEQSEQEKLVKEYEAQLRAYWAGRGGYPEGKTVHRSPSSIGGRGAFNLGNIGRANNTIEIRLAEGMMDRDSAVAWVKFGQRFLDFVADANACIEAKPKTLNTLLAAIQLDEDATKVLKAKAKNKGNALVAAAPGKIADGVHYDEQED